MLTIKNQAGKSLISASRHRRPNATFRRRESLNSVFPPPQGGVPCAALAQRRGGIMRLSHLMVLLCAVTFFAACSPPGVRDLLEGKRLLESGKYRPAVEKFRAATVQLGGTNAQAYNYLGLACHQAGLFDEAERAYQRALGLNPDLVEARYNLGCLWLGENKLEQARNELTAFTLRRSNSPEGWLKLGTAQLQSRELAAAEKSLGEAIRLNPKNPEALTALGLVRLHRGRASEATQLFSQALKADPGYAPALLDWAIVEQENLRDPRLALQKYLEYLALKPVPEKADAVRALVRQLEAELAPPRPAASSNPVQPNSNAAKSPPVETAHNLPPAKTNLPESIHTGSVAKVEPPTNISRSLAASNAARPAPMVAAPRPDTNFEAVEVPPEPVFKSAADVVPPVAPRLDPPPAQPAGTPAPLVVTASKQPPKRSFLQRINPMNLFGSSSSPPAEPSRPPPEPQPLLAPATAVDSALAANFPRYAYLSPAKPESGNHAEAEPLFARALKAQQAQRFDEAGQEYRQAIQSDPGYFDAYYNLALVASSSGNLRASLSAYETALAIRPESLDARYNFALVLKQANYPVDAANELERLLALHPNEARAHLALGNLYAQQLGLPAKARLHYQKVLELDPRNLQAPAVRYWLTDNPK